MRDKEIITIYHELPVQRGVNCVILSRMNLLRGIYILKNISDRRQQTYRQQHKNQMIIEKAIEDAMRTVDKTFVFILQKLRQIAEESLLQTIPQEPSV